jgi:glycosyltransferase involved in cell wall biosynthesis
MSNIKKTLTVIIPTWNRARYLEKNLEILDSYQKRGLDFKILVCNNGSTDGTNDVLKKYESHPHVRIINHPENIKFDRNVASGYLNFDTDYCFCLGDSKTLSYESLEKIISTINEEDIDALVINTSPNITIDEKYYVEINHLLSELGSFITNISSCVVPKSFITLERCERYYNSQFEHYGVFVDALSSKNKIEVKYVPSIKIGLISFPNIIQPHGWSSKTCSIWGRTWVEFILTLPNKVSFDTKWFVIKNLDRQENVLKPRRFIIAKINRDKDFFKDYKNNRIFMPLVSNSPLIIYDIIAVIPFFFYQWMRPIIKRIPKYNNKVI